MRRKTKKRHYIALVLMLGILFMVAKLAYEDLNVVNQDSYNDNSTSKSLIGTELDHSISINDDDLYSSNAILVRLSDQSITMQKNSEEKIYPASLTKIMTAIVAIENLTDLEHEIKLTHTTFDGLYEANAAMAGFQPGEGVRAMDLLYGVLLPSGAECSIALAEQIAGTEKDFVMLMNQKAEALGMAGTHFENTNGFHDENHFTTVKDLSVLLSYALQNELFREIFISSRHVTHSTNKHPGGITIKSTLFEKLSDEMLIDGAILGGKTGYTDYAGLCLATLAVVDNQEYILISAGAKGDHNTEQFNITDALTVYNRIGIGR